MVDVVLCHNAKCVPYGSLGPVSNSPTLSKPTPRMGKSICSLTVVP